MYIVAYLSELISRLTNKLHDLSNNNVEPSDCESKCASAPETPFKEGLLMDYYRTNNQHNYLNTLLAEQVSKLESLI